MTVTINGIESISIYTPPKPSMKENFNNHLKQLQNEIMILKPLGGNVLQIKIMQFEQGLRAFSL